jgi:hypothetical protein
MNLLSPWGLWWLLSVPLLVLFYLFRPEPRRRLSTTFFLWKRSLPDSQGGVYAKRLRSNPLLWLQLLVLILLALYLARPATSWSTVVPTAQKVVMVIDRSASMSAGGAFEQAIEKSLEAVDGLFGFANFGSQPEVMLLAVDREPQILVPFTSDASELRTALRALKPTEISDRLESLRPFLASLITDQKAAVWVFSDHLPEELEIPGLQFSACGTEVGPNAGLVAFSVEMSQDTGTSKPFVYARVQNFSASAEQRLLRVEKMSLDNPERVDSVVVETSMLLPALGGQTLKESFPAARLSSSEPTLFRARLLPVPGASGPGTDGFPIDDVGYTVASPYGQQRVRVSVMPDLKASFLVRALMATQGVELLDWERLRTSTDGQALDLLICAPNTKLGAKPQVRTKFEVSETAPPKEAAVEVLRANPDQPLVKDAGVEWSRLRVQRDATWAADPGETVLLSTASGPALTLKGIGEGQPTLCWRFPLAYSSLPLSPALPVLVSRFLDEYSRPASAALPGSLTTTQRHTRPAGANWKGALEIEPALAGPLAESGQAKSGDRQLPRLGYRGIYKVKNLDLGSASLLAVNLFSTSESACPRTPDDRTFSSEETGVGPSAGQQKRQYREATTPLAGLALLILLIEAAVFIRRGRP